MNTKKKILVVDDEQDLCEILFVNLVSAGYMVETAHSAEEALAIGIARFDLLVLDVMMGNMSGFELAKLLKKERRTRDIPIIFLTAKDTEDDMLHGFNLGADDYISKPFSLKEVIARIKAVLNRTQSKEDKEPSMLYYEGLILNLDTKTVVVDGGQVPFTPTEFHLLSSLLAERGHVLSRSELIERVWPKDVVVTDRTVDVNITRLRKKIGRYAANISTRFGFGYYFEG